jgi:hypothetical protein
MIDPNAVAGYRRALATRGRAVIVRRVSGDAPDITAVANARVHAIVMDYVAKTPVADVKPEGAITLGARNVIVLVADLRALNYPLPVAKNDKVVLNADESLLGTGTQNGDEELNIMAVDPYKRGIAGAIEIVAEGV